MVNVVSTLPDGKCGIGIYTDYLIDELVNNNISVSFIPLRSNNNNPFYYFKKAIKASYDCKIVHIQFEYHIFGNILNLMGIFSLLFYYILKILSYFRGFKIVTTMHEIYEPQKLRDIILHFRKKPNKKTLYALYALFRHYIIVNASDSIIVLSKMNKVKLIQSGVRPRKIIQIPLGTYFPKLLDRETCKRELGINPKKKVVTIFGMISYHKGHDKLIEVAQYFGADIIFLIAGEPNSDNNRIYFNNLKEVATNNVIFYGFVPQEKVPELLNATDIMVLPYREISGSAVLELSISYNLNIITSDLPYFKEIKEKNNCILLFEKNNIDSLKKAIERLLCDEQLQISLKKNTDKYIAENNISKVVEQTLTVYNKLL